MPQHACSRVASIVPVLVLAGLLAACAPLSIPLRLTFEEAPLFPQIHARIGSACRVPIHATDYIHSPGGGGVIRVDFDRASLSRFEQVATSLFTEVVPLPAWPPWRETPPPVDGVIELDDAQFKMTLGDERTTPEHVTVSYRICLYLPEATPVNCWESRAEQVHQRAPFERNLTLDRYLTTLIETTSREALARFMLDFEKDPAVKEWAVQVATRRGPP